MKLDSKKIGVLGAGQLGKMMAQAASNWHLPLHFLDSHPNSSAVLVAGSFTEGNFKSYEDVYAFGLDKDIITIEIEHVNTDALLALEALGKTVHPKPSVLNTIKDKGLQKLFYQKANLPTSDFALYADEIAVKKAITDGELSLPFVQKTRTAGYDGKGVAVIKTVADVETKLLKGACVIEDLVAIQKELAVIVARNESGEIVAYPPVEMEFNPTANLVEFLLCPAQIEEHIAQQAIDLSKKVIQTYDMCGLLAVELFLTTENEILINEVAPRPHNSGHHTIDSAYTSQFEQHLRAILNWPLGSTKLRQPATMLNVLGAEGYNGAAIYEGFERLLEEEGVYMHLYGKTMTRPFRKMGHINVVANDIPTLLEKTNKIKGLLGVISE